jgi:hypothetical protein
MHPNCPSHVVQKDYLHQDDEINNNHVDDDDDDEGLSALLIDPVRAFGEVIDAVDNKNGNEYEDMDSQDEEMMMMEDDEDEA